MFFLLQIVNIQIITLRNISSESSLNSFVTIVSQNSDYRFGIKFYNPITSNNTIHLENHLNFTLKVTRSSSDQDDNSHSVRIHVPTNTLFTILPSDMLLLGAT